MTDNELSQLPDMELVKTALKGPRNFSIKELSNMSDIQLSAESTFELSQLPAKELVKLSDKYELILKRLRQGNSVDPCSNHRFRVEIDGIQQTGFFKCTGLGSSIDVVPYEDGVSPKAQKLPSKATYSDVKLTWGVTASRDLYEWHKKAIRGDIQRKNVKIILIDEAGNDLVRWNLTNAWPRAWEGPDFTAMGTDVAVESLILVCDGIS